MPHEPTASYEVGEKNSILESSEALRGKGQKETQGDK